MSEIPIKALQILVMRTVNNGIISYVFSVMDELQGKVQSDFVMLNEPDGELKEHIRKLGGRLFVLHGRNKNPIKYIRELRRIVRDGRYDIVHAHGNSCTLLTEMTAARLGGAKIRIPHAHNTDCNQKLLHKILRPFFDRSYTAAAACGNAAGRFLFADRPFTVLRNGIDTERFRFKNEMRVAKRKEMGLDGKQVFLHAGSFNEYKNQEFLIRPFSAALRKEPNLFLMFAGDGETRETVMKKASEAGIPDRAIRFLGKRKDIPELLAAADAYVLPSLHEGFPISLVEAQTSGLPFVCADTVTEDAAICGESVYLPLDDRVWERAFLEIQQRKEQERLDAAAVIREAGYDRSDTAQSVLAFYRKQINRE